MRVLIADDNRLMLEGFRRALEAVEDIEIVGVTHTGAQVLPVVERRRPELVALELGMRGEGGVSCLELLSAHHPDVEVVVLSASSAYDDIRWAFSSGAWAFIVKSVNPLDIPAALRHAHEGTVYHAIGLEPGPEDELRAAGLTERELTILKALTRGLSKQGDQPRALRDRANGEVPPRQPLSQAGSAEPARRGGLRPHARDLHRVTPFASGATNRIGSACVAYPRGHAKPVAREREISTLAKGRC